MNDHDLSEPVGASVWERDLFRYLTEHVRIEGAMLAEYTEVAEQTESNAMQYLVGLLVDDERRHHRHFLELAESLKAEAELSRDEPVIPRLDFHKVDQERLVEVTKRLLENERDDVRELKRLRRELRDVKDTTLWGVLVDIMMRDTEKHIAILQFVVDHVDPKGLR